MKITDHTPGHRKLTLDQDEHLDSETLALALCVSDNNSYGIEEANEIADSVFTAIEEMAWMRQYRLRDNAA